MELSERKLKVLQAIIADYVKTAEPVGSRTLSKKPELGYSPATIRNEMADLEEMGYLTHPHTSAGRVPSDKAYRLYVNALMEKPELSKEEKSIIAQRLAGKVSDFNKTIEHAASVLSEITNLTSFAQGENDLPQPFLRRSASVPQKRLITTPPGVTYHKRRLKNERKTFVFNSCINHIDHRCHCPLRLQQRGRAGFWRGRPFGQH